MIPDSDTRLRLPYCWQTRCVFHHDSDDAGTVTEAQAPSLRQAATVTESHSMIDLHPPASHRSR
eukprot:3400486-Rhodomonas_salina.1